MSKSLYTYKLVLSSIVMSKSKNVAFSFWCSSFSFNCLGYIYFQEEENSPSYCAKVVYKPWCHIKLIGTWRSFRYWLLNIFWFKKFRKRFSQYGTRSIPTGMSISGLNSRFLMVIQYFVMRNEMALIKVFLVK